MHDRATVRGVKSGRPNKRRRPSGSAIRRASRRLVGVAGKLVAGGLGLAGLVASGYKVHEFATTDPRFGVARIEVQGAERAGREALLRLAGVELGENIFTLDLAEAAQNVEAHPWVAQARLERELPATIHLKVVEHRPALLVALGYLYYADAEGEIVKRYTPGEREGLPVVTGLSKDQVEADEGESRLWLRTAAAFAQEYRARLTGKAPELAEIHLDRELGLSFQVKGEPTRVLLGHAPWEGRLERYLEVRRSLEERGVRAAEIMLAGERRKDRAVARLLKDGASTALVARD